MPPSNFSGPDSVSFPPPFWQGVDVPLFHSDSTLSRPEQNGVTSTASLFDPVSNTFRNDNYHRVQEKSDWWFGSFAIILIIIVFLKTAYARQLSQMIKAFFIPGNQLPEDRFFPFRFDLFSILFSLVYSISFALLTVSVARDYLLISSFTPAMGKALFFFSALVFLLLLLVKVILVQLSASFFSLKFSGPYYRDLMLTSAFITAAFVIPLIVVNVFSATRFPLIIALALAGLFSGYRLFRAIPVALANNAFSVFHFILYFCTLEALPLIVIGKLIHVFLMPL